MLSLRPKGHEDERPHGPALSPSGDLRNAEERHVATRRLRQENVVPPPVTSPCRNIVIFKALTSFSAFTPPFRAFIPKTAELMTRQSSRADSTISRAFMLLKSI
ncbi:hypothetical protein EYF80_055314 [Liparis tanakae]|uniref:Uncharacterized protein n=1 Tax=Liparis tanakae TaxID=230148 RepID=A0A4Z2F0X6_9TELE|nr:hypothetical protein EYF80_055314 [Liparis tanakae]